MARKAKQAPRRNRAPMPKALSLTLLAILLVVAIAVTAFALAQTRGSNPNAGEVPDGSDIALTPEPESEVEEEPDEPLPEAPVMQRTLAVSSAPGQLMRAQLGQCPGPFASLETSFDGGSNWMGVFLENVGMTRLLQFDLSGEEADLLVGLDIDCALSGAYSFTGGESWAFDPDPFPGWLIDPSDSSVVYTPSGAQTLDCDAVGLASFGDRAAVLCKDSTVLTSENGGAGWSAPFEVPYAVSVGVTPDTFIVVSGGEPDCEGVRTRILTGESLGEASGCVAGDDGRDGSIAAAGDGDAWYLWLGENVLRSFDRGNNWA